AGSAGSGRAARWSGILAQRRAGCSRKRLTVAAPVRDNHPVAAPAHRVVVVEDHPIFRSGLAQCLDAEPDFEVVGQWADGSVAVDDLSARDPDVGLIDIELTGARGTEGA